MTFVAINLASHCFSKVDLPAPLGPTIQAIRLERLSRLDDVWQGGDHKSQLDHQWL